MDPSTDTDPSVRATADDADVLALSKLFVSVVADVLDRMGLMNQAMNHRIRPVFRSRPIVARASTMQAIPMLEILENPYEHELAAVDSITPGSAVIVATGPALEVAVWGELLATRAMRRGAVGAIVDGGVRDVAALERLEFPTFSASVSPNDSRGRLHVISYQEPIVCAGVAVRSGDIVMADADGAVIVPFEVAAEVAEAAALKRAKEHDARADLDAGISANEVYSRHGVL
jgi:4-hydroxy-4-methyl-2-oxoglutarate aldolase